MASIDKQPLSISDFNIEETRDLGRTEILESLHADDVTITASPEQVETIETESHKDDDFVISATTKKVDTTKPPIKKEDKPKLQEGEEEVKDEDFSSILLETLRDEDEKREITKKTSSETVEDEPEEEEPIWASLSKDLVKLGVFSPEEDEEGEEVEFVAKTPEEFRDKFIRDIRKQAQFTLENFLSQHGEEYKNAFDAIFIKGVNPKDYFQSAQEIENLKDINLSEESNQERIIRKVLSQQDFEEEDIDKEIERLKNYGDLEDVSKRFHKVLVKNEEKLLAKKAEQKQAELLRQQQIDQEYEKNVYNVLLDKYKTKDYDGIPVNKQFAEKTMDYLTSKKYQLPTGEQLTEFDKDILELKRPENHSLKVKLGMLLQLIKTDPTLSTIKRKVVSQESNEVFQELARHKTKKTTPAIKQQPKFFE